MAQRVSETSEDILNVIVKNKCDTEVAIASLTYALTTVAFMCRNPSGGIDAAVTNLAKAIRSGMISMQQEENSGGRGRN